MNTPLRKRAAHLALSRELDACRARLGEAEETLRAIRRGEVDAVVVDGAEGARVFTLEGADQAYRVLIESMNEGALTLTAGTTILYANPCFARMVSTRLEQVIGGGLCRFCSAGDCTVLRKLMRRGEPSGSKIPILLRAADGSEMPVQVSLRTLGCGGARRRVFGMVVTDMTESRRNEDMLRTLSRRLVNAQEVERRRLAVELHDRITQPLCGILIRGQALADQMREREEPLWREALRIRKMLSLAAGEVERLSRDLRPGVLDHMGLVPAMREASREFAERTGVVRKLTCARLVSRLPAETELALYRILQEALTGVERHARARNVSVSLRRTHGCVELTVADDGIGFAPDRRGAGRAGGRAMGLLSMRERAAYVGGALNVRSVRRGGTEIKATIPLVPPARLWRRSA